MAIRLPLAFMLGLAIYMIAMVMTTYDGITSLVLQPLMGSILTGLALAGLLVVGSPLLIGAVWERWRRAGWLVLGVTIIGVACLIAAWHPSLRAKVLNPDTGAMVDSFHPALAVGGWIAAMFGVAFCPALGCRGDRRWV
jgi:MFS family permease